MAKKLTREEYIKSIYRNNFKEYTKILKNFNDNLNFLNPPTAPTATFLDYVKIPGQFVNLFSKEVIGFGVNMTVGAFQLFFEAGNDIINAFDMTYEGELDLFTPEGRQRQLGDIKYATINTPLAAVEIFYNVVLEAGKAGSIVGGNIAKLLENDEVDKWFDLNIERIIYDQEIRKSGADSARAAVLGVEGNRPGSTAELFNNDRLRLFEKYQELGYTVQDNPMATAEERRTGTYTPIPTGIGQARSRDIAQTEQEAINQQAILAQSNEIQYEIPKPFSKDNFGTFSYEDVVRGSVDFANVWEKAISAPLANFERRQNELFGDKDWYNAAMSSAQSLGKIAGSIGTAKLGGKFGLNPQQAAQLGRASYFSAMFQDAYQSAINNGANPNDAWTYAAGIAGTETIIEGIGGFRFSTVALPSFLRAGLAEGTEEILASLVQPGLELYSQGTLQPRTAQELYNEAFWSFASGALMGSALKGVESVTLNRTINTKNRKIQSNFELNKSKYGEELALELFQEEVGIFVDFLNKKKVKAQVLNSEGELQVIEMTQQDKVAYIQSNILRNIIDTTPEGRFVLNQENMNKVNSESFLNKDAKGNIINNSDYAISDAVFGVDITDGNKLKVKKVSELNQQERKVYDFLKDKNVPFAIYKDGKNKKSKDGQTFTTTGSYSRNNGVLYISDSVIKSSTPQEMALLVLKHEAIHELKQRDPEAFKRLEEAFSDIVTIKPGKSEDGRFVPILEFKNKEIETLIGDQLRQDVENSLNSYLLDGKSFEETIALMNEEKVAYFTEKVITDAAYLDFIEANEPTLLQRIGSLLSPSNVDGPGINVQGAAAKRLLRSYAKQFKSSLENVSKNRRSLDTYMTRLFGVSSMDQAASLFFNAEAIQKYGLEKIEKSLQTYDQSDNTVTIDGVKVSLEEIMRLDLDTYTSPNRVQVLSEQELVDQFEYNPKQKDKYLRDLRRYARVLDQAILEVETSERKDIRKKLNMIEDILENFENNPDFSITDSEQIKILLESDQKQVSGKEKVVTPAKTLQRTNEGKVLLSTIKRAVSFFKEYTAFKDFKNSAFTAGAATYSETVQSEAEAIDILKTLQILINNAATAKGKYLLRDNYEADYNIDLTASPLVATFMVAPTQQFLDQEVDKALQRDIQIEQQDDIQSAQNNEGLTDVQRKELQKYYTSKEMAQTAFNNVVATLENVGIDINDMTIIESSAGGGVFVEVFKEFNPDIEVLSYDVRPEAEGITQQDFLKLEKDFDADSIVIGNPPYAGDLDAQFINKSLEISPIVAYILPATWHSSHSKQKQIDSKYKLIYNERLGIQNFNFNNQMIPVKTVLQVWVDPSVDTRYNTAQDLRNNEPNKRKSPSFYSFVLDGTQNKYDQLKAEIEDGFTFDFAVHRRGNYKNFNEKFTSIDQLSPKSEYIIFKANNSNVLDVLNSIDFEQLALTGSDHRKGFKLYDVIDAFDRNVQTTRTQRLSQPGENVLTDSNGYVLSAEQETFFKQSKIRSEDGKLLRLYHGSLNENITEFSPEFAGQASSVPERIIYFTNNLDTAKDFSSERVPTESMFFERKTGREGTVYEVYLDVKKPFDLRSMDAKQEKLLGDLLAQQFGIEGERGLEWVKNAKQNHQIVKTVLNDTILEENGYDGLIAEMYMGTGIFEYGVIRPEQIKSVNNNNPQDTKNIYDQDDLIRRTQKVAELTDAQKEKLRGIYPSDEFIGEYFEVDKKGNFVPKQKYVRSARAKQNAATLKHKNSSGQEVTQKYTASEYAINVDIGADYQVDISQYDDTLLDIVRLDELTPEELTHYNVLKSLGVRFVMYKEKKSTGVLGFSAPSTGKHDFMFVNVSNLAQRPERVMVTVIHEYTHELFRKNPAALMESVRFMYQNFFEERTINGKRVIEPKTIFKDFLKNDMGMPGSMFVKYLQKNYSEMFKGVDSLEDIGKLFKKAINGKVTTKNDLSALNEILGQFYGYIFTSPTFINKYFKPDDISSYNLFNVYDRISNLTDKDSVLAKKLFEMHGKAFNSAHVAHQKHMRKVFPTKKLKVTPAVVDKFVRDFSDGQYPDKAELINAYLKEMQNGIFGEATSTLNNIIYLSSKLGQTVQAGVNSYEALLKDFKDSLDVIDRLIQNPEDSAYLTKNGVIKEYNSMVKSVLNPAQQVLADIQKLADLRTSTGRFDIMFTDAGYINPYVSIEYITKVIETLDNFVENYTNMDETILRAFGLPDSASIQAIYDKLINAQNIVESALNDFNNQKMDEDIYLDIVGISFIKPIQELFNVIASIQNLNEAKYSRLLNINKVQETVSRKNAQIFYNTLKNSLKSTLTSIKGKARQSESDLNDDIKRTNKVITDLLQTISSNNLNMTSLKKEIFKSLEALELILNKSERMVDFYGTLKKDDDTGKLFANSDAARAGLRRQFMFNIYGFYDALFNENTLQTKFPGSETAVTLGFKPSHYNFAKSISEYLKGIQTRYTSSFDETLTPKELAEKIVNQTSKIKPTDENSNLRKSAFVQNITLRQDLLQEYAQFFKEKHNVDFFETFWNNYYDNAVNVETFLADYDRASIEFLQNNPKLLKWEKQEIDLPEGTYYTFDSDAYRDVQSDAIKEYQEGTNKINKQSEKVKKLKQRKDEQQKIVNDIIAKIRKTNRSSKIYIRLRSQLDLANADLKSARSAYNQSKNELKALRTRLPYELFLKEKLFQSAQQQKLKTPKMSRGAIASLYLSLVREQEMYDQQNDIVPYDETTLKPTNHFGIGGAFNLFDSQKALKDYKKEKTEATKRSYINMVSRTEAIQLLKKIIDSDSNFDIMINYAKSRFEQNYNKINTDYFKKYQRNMPKQNTYIPFRTLNSNWARDWNLKLAGSYNIGTSDGMTMETTMGANTPLSIQNISSVVQGSSMAAAQYSWERMITDFQNLLVTRVDKVNSFYEILQNIDNGSFINFFENTFVDILGVTGEDMGGIERFLNTVLNNTVSATMALNVPSYFKQYISIYTVALRNNLNPAELLKNSVIHGVPFTTTEHRKWLMDNNGNFYFRSKINGIVALAETTMSPGVLGQVQTVSQKVKDVLSAPVGWSDSTVIVSAFATIADDIKIKNPNLTKQQVFEQANDQLNRTVMLSGVANTNTAFRSRYSTDRRITRRVISRYQSENILQISYLLKQLRMASVGFKDAVPLKALGTLVGSSFMSALISSLFNNFRGLVDDEDQMADFLLNEFLIQNMIGMIPYTNYVTNLFEFDLRSDGVRLRRTFDLRVPGISEIISLAETSIRMTEKVLEGKSWTRDAFRLAEIAGNMAGLPVRNAGRLAEFVSKVNDEFNTNFAEWYYSRSAAEQLNKAIRNGNSAAIQTYVERSVQNAAVKNEIIKLALSDKNVSLNLRNYENFQAKNPITDKMETFNIPEKINQKYKLFTQRALQYLIRTPEYRRMSPEEKGKAVQRVFNYYFNSMKNEILVKEYATKLTGRQKLEIDYDKMRRKEILDVNKVVDNAIRG